MLGSIIGDICGSSYERGMGGSRKMAASELVLFPSDSEFTDDSVMTLATATAIIANNFQPNGPHTYDAAYRTLGRMYPGRGYGGMFAQWLESHDMGPYNSFGNGSAMRVSPIGFAFHDEATVLAEAERSAAVTHNHPEGIKGAQATALAIFLARHHSPKEALRQRLMDVFGYDLNHAVEEIRPTYVFNVTCQGSVPEAIICFLDANSYEETIRNAISLGGDTDTQACIAGGIAEAFYGGVPEALVNAAMPNLDDYFINVINEFYAHINS